VLRTHASQMPASVDEDGLEVGRLAAFHSAAEWRPSHWAFVFPEARSAASFTCRKRPSTSCRLAGMTRLSTNHMSTSCRG
jgi:hypothetical protein